MEQDRRREIAIRDEDSAMNGVGRSMDSHWTMGREWTSSQFRFATETTRRGDLAHSFVRLDQGARRDGEPGKEAGDVWQRERGGEDDSTLGLRGTAVLQINISPLGTIFFRRKTRKSRINSH